MNIVETILMIVPVLLAVALIILIVRRSITERREGDPVDITGVIPAVIILMVAVLLISSFTATIDPYSWDEDSGELTIKKSVGDGDHPWDSYASEVRYLVIEDEATSIASGAFDSLTALEYVSISSSTEVSSGAFSVSFVDPFGASVSDPAGYAYVGGSGTLYQCDPSIYTYSEDGKTLTGLSSSASAAKNIVLPSSIGGAYINTVGRAAFNGNTTIERVLAVPDSRIATVETYAFYGNTALISADLPDSVRTIGDSVFYGSTSLAHAPIPSGVTSMGTATFRNTAITSAVIPAGLTTIPEGTFLSCQSLESVTIPDSVTSIGQEAFMLCFALTSADLPDRLATIGLKAFRGCNHMTSFEIPATVSSVGQEAFDGCTAVTAVSFGSGFSADLGTDCFKAWTFYDTDGTTTIDKTIASNLAGHTFTGTASALVMQS